MVVHCTIVFFFPVYLKFFHIKDFLTLMVGKQFRKRKGQAGKSLKDVKKLIFC